MTRRSSSGLPTKMAPVVMPKVPAAITPECSHQRAKKASTRPRCLPMAVKTLTPQNPLENPPVLDVHLMGLFDDDLLQCHPQRRPLA